MSDVTKIQGCDSTVNSLMGCGGCELFPPPAEILHEIDKAAADVAAYAKKRPRN